MSDMIGRYYIRRCTVCNEPVKTTRAARKTCGGECAKAHKRAMGLAWAKRPEQRAKSNERFREWYEDNRVRHIANVTERKANSSSRRMRSAGTSSGTIRT